MRAIKMSIWVGGSDWRSALKQVEGEHGFGEPQAGRGTRRHDWESPMRLYAQRAARAAPPGLSRLGRSPRVSVIGSFTAEVRSRRRL